MKRVLSMIHRGVRCAVPADQAMDIKLSIEVDRGIDLWTGVAGSAPASHAVRICTANGDHYLRCVDPRLTDLLDGTFGPLPDLLQEIMGLPHVVGAADLDGELVWLVDVQWLALERSRGERT